MLADMLGQLRRFPFSVALGSCCKIQTSSSSPCATANLPKKISADLCVAKAVSSVAKLPKMMCTAYMLAAAEGLLSIEGFITSVDPTALVLPLAIHGMVFGQHERHAQPNLPGVSARCAWHHIADKSIFP